MFILDGERMSNRARFIVAQAEEVALLPMKRIVVDSSQPEVHLECFDIHEEKSITPGRVIASHLLDKCFSHPWVLIPHIIEVVEGSAVLLGSPRVSDQENFV